MRFETGLREARLERGIDLLELATRTRLSPRVVQQIDEGRFAELPGGLYARAYIRAFASEVGLDAREVLLELEPVLPTVEDPIEGLRDAARHADPTPAWIADLAGRLGAAGFDAMVLLVIHAVLIQLVAATCGVTVGDLLHRAGGGIAALCAVPVVLYFIVFEGIGGCTPGGRVCSVPLPAGRGPLHLRTILVRALLPHAEPSGPVAVSRSEVPDRHPARLALRMANDGDEQLA